MNDISSVNPTGLTGINTVVVCPDLKTRDALIRAIAAASNIEPELKSDSPSARRAHYAPAMTKTTINTPSVGMTYKLGEHRLALAIETTTPLMSALMAKRQFECDGYEAEIITQAQPEFPDGFAPIVKVPALEGIVLIFWPKPESISEEVRAILPKREEWTMEDTSA